jgi:hypothetical protein
MFDSIDEQWHECSRSAAPDVGHMVTGQWLQDGSWTITGFHLPGNLTQHTAGTFWALIPEWIFKRYRT